jgi:hypothetical protein
MSNVLAATLGAFLVIALQLIARAISPSAHRAKAWRQTHRRDDSFRRYVGLIVPDDNGTTEIDEVLVTPAGVFVVEKKDFGAWIYGAEGDENWTAVYANREKHRFQNPIRQNYRHVNDLPPDLSTTRS